MEEGRATDLNLSASVAAVEEAEKTEQTERDKYREEEVAKAKKLQHLADQLRFENGTWKDDPYKTLTGHQQRQLAPESTKLVERTWLEFDLSIPEDRKKMSEIMIDDKTMGRYSIIDQDKVFYPKKRLFLMLVERYQFKHI